MGDVERLGEGAPTLEVKEVDALAGAGNADAVDAGLVREAVGAVMAVAGTGADDAVEAGCKEGDSHGVGVGERELGSGELDILRGLAPLLDLGCVQGDVNVFFLVRLVRRCSRCMALLWKSEKISCEHLRNPCRCCGGVLLQCSSGC